MTRRDPDVSALTNLDALILAQAVYELGGNSWSDVAKLLSKHPLISHPKSFFTPQSCEGFYKHLRKEASLEVTEEDAAIRAPLNLKLAQIQYQARLIQLRDLIGEEEEKFKKLWNEIETIRNGQTNATQVELKESTHPHTEDIVKPASSPADITPPSAVPPAQEVDSLALLRKLDIKHLVQTESLQETESVSVAISGPQPTEDVGEVGLSGTSNIQVEDRQTQGEQEPTMKADDDTSSLSNAPSPQAIQIDDLFEAETEENEEPSRELEQQKLDQTRFTGHPESVPELAQDSMVVDEIPLQEPSTTEEMRKEEHVTDPSPNDQPQLEMTIPMEVEEGPSGPSETPAGTPKRASPHPEDHSNNRPVVERTPEPVSAEDGGESSDDEPLNVQKNRKPSRRGKSSATAARAAKARRRRKSSAAVEILSIENTSRDQDGKPEVNTGSPDPEGPSTKRQGKRTASVLEDHDTRDKKRARDGSEPAEEEDTGSVSASVARARRRADAQTPAKKFQNVIGMLHSQISQHRNGTIFHNPIRDSEAPDYHDIVKRPMDLKTVKTKIRDGVITNSLEFQRDIYLMFANAMMYNRPGSDVYVMAEDMMFDCEDYIQTFRQTEGFLRGSQR
ncbi:hypothetical protein L218DRAFT_990031 [Marasmius fiardii PR-910]|nr:hypothetical protein L218DRAFT_990031 [Marasmius fiardii PR-910]